MAGADILQFPGTGFRVPDAANTLAHAPFAALIFKADNELTLLWRNPKHARMSQSEGRQIAGQGMFEAFPPAEGEGAAAMQAIHVSVAKIVASGQPDEIGPYRYDLQVGGRFIEHHWRMQHTPIFEEDEIYAVLQTAYDVTPEVLRDRLAQTHRRAAMRTVSLSYFSYDPQTDVFERADDVDEMFGLEPSADRIHAKPFFERVHPDDLLGVNAEVERVFAAPRGETASFDYRVVIPDQDERHIRIRGEIVTDPVDRREKLVGTFFDITDLERTRIGLEHALQRREAVIGEANHRINNSLQMATAMLSMEARALTRSKDATVEGAAHIMDMVAARMRAIADVHALLQFSDEAQSVAIDAVIGELVDLTRQSIGVTEDGLSFRCNIERALVSPDIAVNTALVVNEFLLNAAKYGISKDSNQADIQVSLDWENEKLVASVENAVVPENEAIGRLSSTGLGTRLIDAFAQKIDGIYLQRSDGDRYRAELHISVDCEASS